MFFPRLENVIAKLNGSLRETFRDLANLNGETVWPSGQCEENLLEEIPGPSDVVGSSM